MLQTNCTNDFCKLIVQSNDKATNIHQIKFADIKKLLNYIKIKFFQHHTAPCLSSCICLQTIKGLLSNVEHWQKLKLNFELEYTRLQHRTHHKKPEK